MLVIKHNRIKSKLEKGYDELYSEAEAILEEFKPCNHRNISGRHMCMGIDPTVSCGESIREILSPIHACCVGCKFIMPTGCSANKPLACKTWLCVAARYHNPVAYAKLRAVADKAYSLHLFVTRGDKEESIQNAMNMLGFIDCKDVQHYVKKFLKNLLTFKIISGNLVSDKKNKQ